MFKFDAAQNRRHELGNANLSGGGQLVQAMRAFGYRSAFVMCVNSYHKVLQTEKERRPRRIKLSPNALYVLDQACWQSMMANLRAILECDPKDALGAGAIAALLRSGDARSDLCNYLDSLPHTDKMVDLEARERYLDYIQNYCAILADQQFPIAAGAHPLVEKVALVRRAATKSVMHSTLDDFKLYGHDLQDVVLAVIVVAFAIQAVMGDAAVDGDLAAIERASLDGAASLLGVETDTEPHFSIAIRGFMPAWVSLGQEFPDVGTMRRG